MRRMIHDISPHKLRARAPFKDLFPIREALLKKITADIEKNGFDQAQPIVVCRQVVIDGHTRLTAAKRAKCFEVPCICLDPDTSEAALLRYAIHCQRDRRNMTDADIARCVAECKKAQEGRPKTVPDGTVSGEQAMTAKDTAELLGVSERKVKRTRVVNDRATPEVKAAVASGEMSINKAYNKTVKPKPDPTVSLADQYATLAIRQLRMILPDDPNEVAELTRVQDYITRRLGNGGWVEELCDEHERSVTDPEYIKRRREALCER